MATVAQKKKLYGKKFRIPVGGRTPGGADARTDTTIEPVCFNTLPKELEEELLHRYFVSSCVDLTPEPFTLAEVCIQKRATCFGIAWADYHAEQKREKLRMAALKCMCAPGHVHCNAKGAPWQRESPVITTSSLRVSWGAIPGNIVSRRKKFLFTLARLSRNTRAHARSIGRDRRSKLPERLQDVQ